MSDQPKEHPIPFSGPKVRAILEGRKFQDRRSSKKWLKVKAGDLLWVQETWAPADKWLFGSETDPPRSVWYRASPECPWYCDDPRRPSGGSMWNDPDTARSIGAPVAAGFRWRPSCRMPRWASRITLAATEDARVERLLDISEVVLTFQPKEHALLEVTS